jgi:serine/threonine protein kinase
LKSQDPKSIGRWKLIGRLGSGGMGIVYLAEKNIQRVALKVAQNFMDSPEVRARLQREVEVMSKIKSARVAKVIDSDVNSDFAWIATEFIDGPDLKTYIESGGVLNEQDWKGLALGLFEGLEEVHAEGIIHRDIKPSNILISNNGPKLIDFGIAQGSDATSLTSTGLVAGSPAWLAPEQIHGEALTSAADIFSAGSVLKFAATGNSPWGESTSTTTPVIFNKILTKDPDFTGLTTYQKTFLSKLMHKNAKQRITARQATIEIKNQMHEISQESIIEKERLDIESKYVPNTIADAFKPTEESIIQKERLDIESKYVPNTIADAFKPTEESIIEKERLDIESKYVPNTIADAFKPTEIINYSEGKTRH